jgi:hypothetical protein
MSKKANYSLSLFEMGAIANDGTMGTSLTAFDDPVRDTCVLQMADGTKQNSCLKFQTMHIIVSNTW